MAVCPGIKRDGGRCTTVVEAPRTHCYQHDPERAGARRRAASKAGKSRPDRELGEVRGLLRDLTDGVLDGRVNTGVAVVCNQLLNSRLRAIEVARRVQDVRELAEQLDRLEQAVEARTKGQAWTA